MEPTNDLSFADVGAAWDAWLQTQYWPSWRDHTVSLLSGRADAAVRFRGYVQGAALARSEATGTPPPWETGEEPPAEVWDAELEELMSAQGDRLLELSAVEVGKVERHPAAGEWLDGFLRGYLAVRERSAPPAA